MANKINDFIPEDGLLKISKYLIKDILEKGFAYMTLPTGRVIKITSEDLVIKKSELLEFERKVKTGEIIINDKKLAETIKAIPDEKI